MTMLAERVTERREALGWNQKELAQRAGVHPSHISTIESGARRHLQVATVTKIAAALGVTEQWLVHGIDDGGSTIPDEYAVVVGFAREHGLPPDLLLEAARLLVKARIGAL